MRIFISTIMATSLMLGACTVSDSFTATPGDTQDVPYPVASQAVRSTMVASLYPQIGSEEAQAELQLFRIQPGESTVSYEVGETFFNQGNRFNLAIGVTTEIQGEVWVDVNHPATSRLGMITVDISQFRSDSARRDNAIRERFLESARYPLATFQATRLEGLPESYTPGEEIAFTVVGDLTVRQVTREVAFQVTARLEGGILIGVATTTLLMSDFGVGPIEIAGILGTEDEVKLTFNFVARP